jgi:chemotaxis protein methyltransferase CheR
MIAITPDEIQVMSRYVHGLCGVFLDETKGYLFENRLAPLLETLNCSNFSELYFKAKSDVTKSLPRKIIDALTTGETFFFRDETPFEMLQHKIIPALIDKKTRAAGPGAKLSFRIWSAACSSGQEVYSIAMVLKELLDVSRHDIHILGTDISDQAIALASRGHYQPFEIERGLSREKLERHFERLGDFSTSESFGRFPAPRTVRCCLLPECGHLFYGSRS